MLLTFFKIIQKPKDLEEKREYGRGNRKRTNVNYSDELSELQFLKMLDEDDNSSNVIYKKINFPN